MGAEPALFEALDRLEGSGASLRRRDRTEIAILVAEAWALIADPERALGRAAREHLPASTGLSLPMVAWALSHGLRHAGEDLAELARRMGAPPGTLVTGGRLGALVLAGNVFTACVQPLSVALLSRTPVLVKASRKDDVMPRLFHAALAQVDAELAESIAIVTPDARDESWQSTLLSRADVVSVYGSDQTVAAIRARLPATSTLAIHGHGVGAAYVPRDARRRSRAATCSPAGRT
ncbi:MAG: hypothetical protein K8H88_31410, partial [Sandaracinaceae bacterium]|nr:hypothetical protein [Sandaracinaceae bacterium]